MKNMPQAEVHKLIKEIDKAEGTIFSVKFIKKTDGALREMICRRHVKKGVKGLEDRRNEAIQHNVLTVFDMRKNAFRRINLQQIIYLKILGDAVIDNIIHSEDEVYAKA